MFLRCCLNLSLTPCPSPVIWAWRTGVHAHLWPTLALLISQCHSWPLSQSRVGVECRWGRLTHVLDTSAPSTLSCLWETEEY